MIPWFKNDLFLQVKLQGFLSPWKCLAKLVQRSRFYLRKRAGGGVRETISRLKIFQNFLLYQGPFSIHFTITGLKNVVHYTCVFVLQGFIILGLSAYIGAHCHSFFLWDIVLLFFFGVELFSVFCFFCFTSFVLWYSQKQPLYWGTTVKRNHSIQCKGSFDCCSQMNLGKAENSACNLQTGIIHTCTH